MLQSRWHAGYSCPPICEIADNITRYRNSLTKMKIVALAGGVGGAKLVYGLSRILPSGDLTIIVNTGDDFEHLGLYISPDLDTVCYTLAGLANPKTGWGRSGESFHMLTALKLLKGDDWFRLGDRDLATHIKRTHLLQTGKTLSQITRSFSYAWGIQHTVIPMTNDCVRTIVDTEIHGEILFQQYFVRWNYKPKVRGIRFEGIETSRPAPGVLAAIKASDAIIICPSNPWLSIDPIINIPGIKTALEKRTIVAISPIIGGKAVKGPAAKIFKELGYQSTAVEVYNHYSRLLSGFIIDRADEALVGNIPVPVHMTNILMKTNNDRKRLAQNVLNFIRTL